MTGHRRTRGEALLAGALWVIFAVWVITITHWLGYVDNDYSTTFGVPTWIFWGVLVPWVVAVVVNTLFAFCLMADDD